jgi:hypothetical protein
MAHAQAPLPFDVPAIQLSYGGNVNAVIVAPDGGVILGGNFSTVNGIARSNIARLQPNGTLDPAWNPGADSGVYALALDTFGELIVGGEFNFIGGASRSHIAKLQSSSQGSVDPNWSPYVDSTGVFALETDSSGWVYLGGYFGSVGGPTRLGIAKVSASSGVTDPTWNPAGSGSFAVYSLKCDNHGSIFVGGSFPNIGGKPQQNVAKLSTSGTGAADTNWNPAVDGAVNALALDASGNLYIGGSFSLVGGSYRGGLAKLSATGTGALDQTWNPAGPGEARTYSLALDGLGSIYVGGDLGTGNLGRTNIAKLSASGSGAVDTSWSADADDRVVALAIDPAGNVYVGGLFNTLGDQGRVGFGTLNAAGNMLQPNNLGGSPGHVTALARQADGGIIIGGSFRVANGAARYNLARLLPGGALDTNWDPGQDSIWDNNPEVRSLAIDLSGDVFVSGGFTQIGGQPQVHMAKIASTGATYASWNAGLDSLTEIDAIVPTSSGSVFTAGVFYSISGVSEPFLAKLSGISGAADATWNPAPDNAVRSLAFDASGLYVGGDFANIGGLARNHIAKLSASTGAADSLWNPSADGFVTTLALDANDILYVAGNFTNIGGQPRAGIAKLGVNGNADINWNPTIASVESLAIGAGDSLYVSGSFTSIQGQTRTGVARLSQADGILDAQWNPILGNSIDPFGLSTVHAMVLAPDQSLYIGGAFTSVDGRTRSGFAILEPDEIFKNGFE